MGVGLGSLSLLFDREVQPLGDHPPLRNCQPGLHFGKHRRLLLEWPFTQKLIPLQPMIQAQARLQDTAMLLDLTFRLSGHRRGSGSRISDRLPLPRPRLLLSPLLTYKTRLVLG